MNKDSLFLIVGAQKAGTTALHDYLIQHPQVFGAIEKELHFFNSSKRHSLGYDFYHSMFPMVSRSNFLYLDASPSYLVNHTAYHRIYEYNPKVRMLAILRDPVERAYSAWNMYRSRYQKNRNWFFEDWLSFVGGSLNLVRRTDNEMANFLEYAKKEIELVGGDEELALMVEAPIIAQGHYANQLRRFYSLFSKDQILIIESSNLRKDAAAVLRRIEDFLGLQYFEWQSVMLAPVFVGEYSTPIPECAANFLSSYYASHNEALFDLIGTRYKWR